MKVLKQILILMVTVLLPTMGQSKAASTVGVELERVGGMTHLEFNGFQEWDYELKKEGSKLHLTLPKLENVAVKTLSEFKSLLIDSIQIDNSIENKSKLILSLSDKRIESFDYLTQDPSHLVVDLYVSDDSILESIRRKNIAAIEKKLGKKVAAKNKKKTPNRKPAFAEFFVTEKSEPQGPLTLSPTGSIDDLFDFGSLSASNSFNDSSMEAKVVEANGNIYLRFPLLKLKNKHLQDLQSFRPEYEIKKSFSDENKQARNLLKLFNQRSFASFIKAKKIFKANFPKSTYDEILNYVEADTWIELWKVSKRPEYLSKAMNLYKMLIERFPTSRIAERTLINAGLLSHKVGEYFVATKMLRRYIKLYPESPFNNYIKIYLGDSLANLKNYDGAKKILDQVVDAGEEGSSVEAQYRLGDIFFLKQSFRRSERLYLEALKKNPREAIEYPNALFNMGEAQFNLAEYESSLQTYKKFFKNFPNHPYGGFALTRIGELIDILYRDKKRAQGFYNESFFRYRNTTGGTIARMRSLSQRFKDMKKQELETSIAEIKKREKAIDLKQVDEFAAFMVSDGYYGRSDYLKAANTLINYFQINPKPVNLRKFEKRISRAIAGQVRQNLKEGLVVEALEIIESHQKSWLSKSRRVDVQLFRAQAYEMMGLNQEALDSYQRIIKRMDNLVGTKEETERKVFEYYPSFDQVYLRQAVTEYASNNKTGALSLLQKVKSIKDLDKQSKIDFHFTLSRLSFDKKKYEDALKTAELVDVDGISSPEKKEKFNVYLSEVYEKNQMFDKALSILEKFYKKSKGEQDQVYVLSRLFQLYRDKGMKEKAIEAGENLLTEYDTKYSLDKERYYLGELYFNENKTKQAQRVWKDLTKQSMWSELAENKQVTDQWQDQTKKSMNRIPAMAK